jgi:hypothetical protein
MRDAGQAFMGYFYFDFRDTDKQDCHGLVTSLLTQLSSQPGPHFDILSRLYSDHDSGVRKPSDIVLARCLREMLTLADQRPTYFIMDALDECPNTSGWPSPRETVLHFIKGLVESRIPNLHICVTSRPEIDIRYILEPLTSCRVSLHDESGQRQDIVDYIISVVYSDRNMRRWREEDKELVIKTLSERSSGM